VSIDAAKIKELAFRCGFELAGIAPAAPSPDFERFNEWRASGMAGEMSYLTDHRGDLRSNPRNLLPTAKSIVCLGRLYNTAPSHKIDFVAEGRGWISRYAWGADYHDVLRADMQRLVEEIARFHSEPFDSKICVDSAPLLERSLARQAGVGWIGKNTCLLNQEKGSWFFLGEILLSIELRFDHPAPDRCGTCTRCIDACPTEAIVANQDGSWSVDSRLCISYLTIEKRGSIEGEVTDKIGHHLFGCDICQDVCPWNRRAATTTDETFSVAEAAPSLTRLAAMTEEEFRETFRRSPVWRAKYSGFLRNVAIAMGNSGRPEMEEVLQKLANHSNETISSAAIAALAKLNTKFAASNFPTCKSEDQSRSS
jgi:epoxyqueuosine reductase